MSSVGNELSQALVKLEKTQYHEWLSNSNLYLPEFLNKIFNRYIEILKSNLLPKYPLTADEIKGIQISCETIVQTSTKYLEGKIFTSYEVFKNGLGEILNTFWIRKSDIYYQNTINPDKNEASTGPLYYRARKHKPRKTFHNFDLFHVPFDDRNKIQNYRYSISGLPCLYLSNRPFVNWLELNEPELNNIWFSRFHFIEPLTFLDLAYVGSENDIAVHHKFSTKDSHLKSLNSWPIRFACNLPRKRKEGIFHEEYIIPQLTLQLVQENALVDGVVYNSSYSNNQDLGSHLVNYAIPAKTSRNKGYCNELMKLMEWTEPKRFRGLKLNKRNEFNYDKFDEKFFDEYMFQIGYNAENMSMPFFKYKKKECSYFTSVFFEIERRLLDSPTKSYKI